MQLNNGWVKIHRKFLDWEWYDDSLMVHLFIHILIKCNHRDKKWRGISIKRGQFLTSYDKLATELHSSYKKIRTRLEKLEKTGEIVRQMGSQYTLITVCNYDTYQVNEDSEGRQTGSQRAGGGQAEGRRRATTKNDKNNKNDKEGMYFLEFWNMYGKKQDRAKCEAKFNRLKSDEIQNILAHVPRYVKATPDIKYRKNPLTYLNSRTWEDEDLPQTEAKPLISKSQYFTR